MRVFDVFFWKSGKVVFNVRVKTATFSGAYLLGEYKARQNNLKDTDYDSIQVSEVFL